MKNMEHTCNIQTTYLWGALRTVLIRYHYRILELLHNTERVSRRPVKAKLFIAGSFATHYDLSNPTLHSTQQNLDQCPSHTHTFPYNDIDVFVIDPHISMTADPNTPYHIQHSIKLDLYLNNDIHRTCGCYRPTCSPKLNIIIVWECRDLYHLISNFDINCCQVGYEYCLQHDRLHNRTVTTAYTEFVRTRLLKAIVHQSPIVTYFRLLRKHIDLKCSIEFSPFQINCIYRASKLHTQKEIDKDTFDYIRTHLEHSNELHFLYDYFDVEFILGDVNEEDLADDNELISDQESDDSNTSSSFRIIGPRYRVQFRTPQDVNLHYQCLQGHSTELYNHICHHNWDIAFQRDIYHISPLEYLLHSMEASSLLDYKDCIIAILQQTQT